MGVKGQSNSLPEPPIGFCETHCGEECAAIGRCLKSIQMEVARMQQFHKHNRWRLRHDNWIEYDGTLELERKWEEWA